MTTTTTTHLEGWLASLDELDREIPVPSAEDLARPIVAGIYRLHDVFTDRAHFLELVADDAEGVDMVRVREAVAVVDRVAALVAAATSACVLGGLGELVSRQLIDDVSGIGRVRQALNSDAAYDLYDGAGASS